MENARSAFQPPREYRTQYVSPKQAAEMTGLSIWSWRSFAYSGKVASVKISKSKQSRLLIPLSEVERVMAEGLRPALAAEGV